MNNERAQIVLMLNLYNLLDNIGTGEQVNREEANKLMHEIDQLYPNLLDYDTKGNYVGPVSYENGWSP